MALIQASSRWFCRFDQLFHRNFPLNQDEAERRTLDLESEVLDSISQFVKNGQLEQVHLSEFCNVYTCVHVCVYMGLLWQLSGKESTWNAGDSGDTSSIPGLGGSEMATCFSIFTWEIKWTEKPGRLQSTASKRVRHNLVTACTQECVYITANW